MSATTQIESIFSQKAFKTTTIEASGFSETPLAQTPGDAVPVPALNGRLLVVEGTGKQPIYFVWWGGPESDPSKQGGYRCHIPNWDTFILLFKPQQPPPQKPVYKIAPLPPSVMAMIKEGPELTSGAILAQGNLSPKTYLVTNNRKNHILDLATVDYCQFQMPSQTIPQILLDCVPDGITIDYKQKG